MKPYDTIDCGNNWFAVKVPISDPSGTTRIQVKHRCTGSAVVHPIQQNTHRHWGVRVRCKGCKAEIPAKVKIFLKLQNLHAKVTE